MGPKPPPRFSCRHGAAAARAMGMKGSAKRHIRLKWGRALLLLQEILMVNRL